MSLHITIIFCSEIIYLNMWGSELPMLPPILSSGRFCLGSIIQFAFYILNSNWEYISNLRFYLIDISDVVLYAPSWVVYQRSFSLNLHYQYFIWFQEADRFRAEEQKPQSSSSSQTNRENMKCKCSALIDNVVTKAVKGM